MTVYFFAKDTPPVGIYIYQTFLSLIITIISNIPPGVCFFDDCSKFTGTPEVTAIVNPLGTSGAYFISITLSERSHSWA